VQQEVAPDGDSDRRHGLLRRRVIRAVQEVRVISNGIEEESKSEKVFDSLYI